MHDSLRHFIRLLGLRVILFLSLLFSVSTLLGQNVCDIALDSLRSYLYRGDFETARTFLSEAEQICPEQEDSDYRIKLAIERGIFHQARGGFQAALQAYFEALDLCTHATATELRSEVLNNIGAVHQYQGNYAEAEGYYLKSLHLRRDHGELRKLGQTLNNFGALYGDMDRLDDALSYHADALDIWKSLQDTGWIAIAYSNIGECMDMQGQRDSARSLYHNAILLLESQSMYSRMARVEIMIANTYLHENRVDEALPLCRLAWAQAQEQGVIHDLHSAAQCLYECYKRTGNSQAALVYYELAVQYRDSMSGAELSKQVTKLELDYRFQQEQMADSMASAKARLEAQFQYEQELANEEQKQNLFMLGGLFLLLLAIGLMSRLRFIRRSRSRLAKEKDRSDKLLLNILPANVAEELKTTGKASSKSFNQASILFSDFVDFTQVSKDLGPEALVIELNVCFQAFDKIVLQYGLEKIKTIGDAYMAVGGLNENGLEDARSTILAGLEMQRYIQRRATLRKEAGFPFFQMRLGIHTGPVVAGVVGDTKFQYDIWGDAVNIASRMESAGATGEVNVSPHTRTLLDGDESFQWMDRPSTKVKGLGEMKMAFVRAAKA